MTKATTARKAAGSNARTTRKAARGKTPVSARPAGATKLAILTDLLARPEGATLDDFARATGWQTHSVRGALAGSLRKKGYTITREKADSVRRYRIEASA